MKQFNVGHVCTLVLALLGCGCLPPPTVRPGFEPEKVRTVAVLPFSGDVGPASVTADILENKLLECGVDVVDRSRVAALLAERTTAEIDFVEIGKVLGVDLLISGAIRTSRSGGLVMDGSFRGVDTQDGRVQFSGQFGVGGVEAFQAGTQAGQQVCAVLVAY